MGRKTVGKTIRISPARHLIHELLVHATRVPSMPLSRTVQIPNVLLARQSLKNPPSWGAIFVRAYGLLCQEVPELRRAWMRWPYARLYEHPHCECAVLIERVWQDEHVVFIGKIHSPETSSITLIHEHLKRFQEDDIWSISPFRQMLRIARMPWPLRRFIFSTTLYFSGAKRAKRFGTGTVASLGKYRVEQNHPQTPLTSYLSFGSIDRTATVNLKLIYDHRVMDGGTVARALVKIEEILNQNILEELKTMQSSEINTPNYLNEKKAC